MTEQQTIEFIIKVGPVLDEVFPELNKGQREIMMSGLISSAEDTKRIFRFA